jgi:hypothetical protein
VIHGPAIAKFLHKRERRDPYIIKRKERLFLFLETGDLDALEDCWPISRCNNRQKSFIDIKTIKFNEA